MWIDQVPTTPQADINIIRLRSYTNTIQTRAVNKTLLDLFFSNFSTI